MKDKERFDAAIEFLKDCQGKRVHIVHDYDVDGISGGLFLRHALERLGAQATASTRQGRGMSMEHEELERIKREHDPERLVITDQDPRSFGHHESLRWEFPHTPVMVIDHHFVQETGDILLIHPEPLYGVKGFEYPSAKLIHDLAENIAPVEDLEWLVCTGILGDMGGERFREFLEQVAQREGIEMPTDAYKSEFAQIGEAIDCCSTSSEEELQAYVRALKEQETFQGALSLGNPCSAVKDEVDSYVREGLDLADSRGAVHFVPVESQYGIAGWVATLISVEHPDKIIITIREQVDGISCSARHQGGRVHLGEIQQAVCAELGGRGGGHPPAAGGWIPLGRLEDYKNRVIEEVDRQLSKAS